MEFVADAYASAIAARPWTDQDASTAEETEQVVAARVRKILYNVTGKMQVSAPMACSKLLNFPTPSRSSEVFAPLHLAQLYNAMKGANINTRLVRTGGGWGHTSFFHDFIYRPVGKFNASDVAPIDFDAMSSFEYVRGYQVLKKPLPRPPKNANSPPEEVEEALEADAPLEEDGDDDSGPEEVPDEQAAAESIPKRSKAKTTFSLHPEHPLFETHQVVARTRLAVPTIVGPRLANINSLETDDEVPYHLFEYFHPVHTQIDCSSLPSRRRTITH